MRGRDRHLVIGPDGNATMSVEYWAQEPTAFKRHEATGFRKVRSPLALGSGPMISMPREPGLRWHRVQALGAIAAEQSGAQAGNGVPMRCCRSKKPEKLYVRLPNRRELLIQRVRSRLFLFS